MIADKPYDEIKTLELLASGSEYAFTQLFDHYRPRLYHAALKYLKVRELAEEIVQDVFLKVWQKRTEMTHVRNFNAYLFVMTRNLVFDHLKKVADESVAKQGYLRELTHENGTERLLLEKQYEQLLSEAVDKLPPQQKLIFKLAKIEGLSHEAIAQKLKLSKATVKRQMASALGFLRLKLQHHLNTVVLGMFVIFC